jgi:hypothetical protein
MRMTKVLHPEISSIFNYTPLTRLRENSDYVECVGWLSTIDRNGNLQSNPMSQPEENQEEG